MGKSIDTSLICSLQTNKDYAYCAPVVANPASEPGTKSGPLLHTLTVLFNDMSYRLPVTAPVAVIRGSRPGYWVKDLAQLI